MSKSSGFKSLLRPSAATASVPDTSRETESEMKISIVSDITHQPSTTSPSHQPATEATSTAQDPVLDQFQPMRLMISSFLGAHQLQVPDNHSATISTLRLSTLKRETF